MSLRRWICDLLCECRSIKECESALYACDVEREGLSGQLLDALDAVNNLTNAVAEKIAQLDEKEELLEEIMPLANSAVCAAAISPYWIIIVRVAMQYSMDPYMIAGVIQAESSFDPLVVGDSGLAVGLGQFHEGAWSTTWPGLELERRRDPEYAVEGVARYFCINWQNIQAAHPYIDDHKWGWAAYTGGPALVGKYLDAHGDDWENFDEWTKIKVDRYYKAAQRLRDTCPSDYLSNERR